MLWRATDKYRRWGTVVILMSWRCRGDVLTTAWRWYCALWRAHKRWGDFTGNHILCACWMGSWIKERSLPLCLRITGWRAHRRKHCQCITDASQSNPGISAMDHPNHPWYYHIEYTSPMFTRACWYHRRCAWDILKLGVPRRISTDCCVLFGAIWRCIADGSWRQNIG